MKLLKFIAIIVFVFTIFLTLNGYNLKDLVNDTTKTVDKGIELGQKLGGEN